MLLNCTFLSILTGQIKGDYNWMLGTNVYDPANQNGGTRIDFNSTPPQISDFNSPITLLANASISDDEGNLQFYTNGCYVVNRNFEIMPHGDSLSAGFTYTQWCVAGDGYPSHQGVLALPFPGSDHLYVIVHYKNADTGVHDHNELLYSVVDMNLDGGLGDVTLKNQLIYHHDFFYAQLTAVRHGNGRDWWIVAPERGDSDKYFLFLLSPEGVSGPFV